MMFVRPTFMEWISLCGAPPLRLHSLERIDEFIIRSLELMSDYIADMDAGRNLKPVEVKDIKVAVVPDGTFDKSLNRAVEGCDPVQIFGVKDSDMTRAQLIKALRFSEAERHRKWVPHG